MNWWPSSDGAAPLYATRRNPDLDTDGPQVGVVARALGTPLIPWQQYVVDVGNERRPDGSYEYEIVIVSVPRQTGKTTILRANGTHRCLVCGRDVFYTAQTGKDARERWLDLVKILRVQPAFKDRVKVGLRGGSEQIQFPGGAAFRVFAPTVESLHGYTPPTVKIDEAFALTGMAGDLLMGAIGPAQITIRDRQIWIVSTAGTAESTFLHDWIDRGMEGTPRVACFVWAAGPAHDPFNVDHIREFHPGVGFELNGKVLTAEDVFAQADRNSRAEYERAFANRRTITMSHLIPAETWRPLKGEGDHMPPNKRTAVLGFDVSADRQSAAIVAAWMDHGAPRVRVILAQPGYSWVASEISKLRREWHLPWSRVVAAGNGPVLDVIERLPGIRVLSEREYATACSAWLASIEDATLRHDGTDALAESVAGLVTRPAVSDGVAFSRRHSVGDSSPAVAGTCATFVAATTRTGKPRSRHQTGEAA